MAKEFSRTRRVADQMQRELAELIQLELKDPRLGMVTVTAVEVTHDYERAKVFFTVLGDASALEASTRALNHSAGYLRSQLAKRIKLRVMPELVFVHDTSIEEGNRMEALIRAAVRKDSDSGPH
jgi:ribosome-binding factor A